MLRRNKYKRYKYMGGYDDDYIIHNEWMEEGNESMSYQDEASCYSLIGVAMFAALAIVATFNPISNMDALSLWLFLTSMCATITVGMMRVAREPK